MNDKRFLTILEQGIHQRSDGHFETPLPFVEENVMLPNNKQMAWRRLMKLEDKLKRDTQFRTDYVTFMNDVINKGYAENVSDKKTPPGRVWYIPHHGVYHPHKPEKIRVLFDCSAQYKGEVLNKHLLQGPDLINNLTGVLCRFRKEPTAFSCDIEAMFYQVGVREEDRDYMRFLWWEDGKLDQDPTEYRMTVHIFGATSSPGCANFALKYTADQFEKDVNKEAAKFVRNDFYVDDGLKSVNDSQSALKLINSSRRLCAMGGFNLHKFTASNKTIIEAIPPLQRAKNVQNIDLAREDLPVERPLGVEWCVETDTFRFRVTLQNKPATRRGILSTVSSIFDPLGLLSPFILTGKRILQELCQDGMDWDEPLSEGIKMRWEKWKADVVELADIRIPRCYKPKDFGTVQTVEMHHFSDASLEGYGACSYLRLIDDRNQATAALVMAKSRVTPAKSVTVPRLELTAAVVSVKIGNFLCKELKFDEIKNVFWTDSNVVLGYINNDSKRFHIYVANRVQQIRDGSSPEQWKHIDTTSNPADIASRGSSAEELLKNDLWWKGPAFLSSSHPIPSSTLQMELTPNDPEVKKTVFATQTSQVFDDLQSRLEFFSCWHRARRAVAVCLRFKQMLKDRLVKKKRKGYKKETNKDIDSKLHTCHCG